LNKAAVSRRNRIPEEMHLSYRKRFRALAAHEDYKEMIATEALGALDAAEERVLNEHLAGCAECRAELDEWRAIASSLALSTAPVEPPTELRGRILDVAHSTPQEGKKPAGRTAVLEPSAGNGDNEESSFSPGKVVPIRSRRRPGSPVRKFAMLAASLAFIALVIALIIVWQRDRQSRQEITRLNEQLNRTQSDLNRTQSDLDREREMREMLTSPDTRLAVLNGTKTAPDASARFAVNKNSGRSMLLAYNLPPAPPGKAYQLWFIADGKPLPGGVFNTDSSGKVETHELVPPEGRSAGVFAVTLEPESGVTAPTGEIYLQGPAS
jgi:anti-sigma-K factor RskA